MGQSIQNTIGLLQQLHDYFENNTYFSQLNSQDQLIKVELSLSPLQFQDAGDEQVAKSDRAEDDEPLAGAFDPKCDIPELKTILNDVIVIIPCGQVGGTGYQFTAILNYRLHFYVNIII